MKKGVFIETANVSRFRAAMRVLEDVEKGRPGMAAVWGQAGLGKTLAAQNYHVKHGGVYVRTLQDWSQNAFLQQICFELCGERHGSANKNKVRIFEALEDLPRTLFIDEADRLRVERIEDLRDIHDVTGAPVVLIGETSLPTRLNARARIDDRIPSEYRVEFRAITPEDVMLYGLEAADLRLTPEASGIITGMTKGNFRRVHNAMLRLEQIAAAAETNQVDANMVRKAGGF